MAYVPAAWRPRYPVQPPPYVPFRRFSLLNCAPIVPGEDGSKWEQGVEYWSDACNLETGHVDGYCAPDGAEWDKTIGSFEPVRVVADPFTVTSGIACNAPNFPAEDRARELLARGEDLGVETNFWRQQMAREDLKDPGEGGVFALDDAIGILEAEAARRYAGQVYIHVPLHALSRLLFYRLADASGPCLRTPYGSVIVAGTGYTDAKGPKGEDPPETGFWILATGGIQIRRSEVFTQGAFDPKKNRRGAIAERTYVIAADCFAAAIKADPCACTPTTGGGSATAVFSSGPGPAPAGAARTVPIHPPA